MQQTADTQILCQIIYAQFDHHLLRNKSLEKLQYKQGTPVSYAENRN